MRNKRIVAGVLMLWLLGCGGCQQAFGPKPKLPAPYTSNGVYVEVTGLYATNPSMVSPVYNGIGGIATNISGYDFKMCYITFDILDGDGAKVGDAMAITQSLKNGERWKFQAIINVPFGSDFTEIRPGNIQVR